jgi:hypothetical protein
MSVSRVQFKRLLGGSTASGGQRASHQLPGDGVTAAQIVTLHAGTKNGG